MKFTLKTLYPDLVGEVVEEALLSEEASLSLGEKPIQKRRTRVMRNQREFNFLTFIIVVSAVIIAMRFIK